MKHFSLLCLLLVVIFNANSQYNQSDHNKNKIDSIDIGIPAPLSQINEPEEPVFIVPKENATFQGGDINTFRLYVEKKLVYPKEAYKANIQGKVIAQFIVNTNGDVVEIKILRGAHPSLDEETKRCIKSSPKWVPGKQNGKVIKQQFVIPIFFEL